MNPGRVSLRCQRLLDSASTGPRRLLREDSRRRPLRWADTRLTPPSADRCRRSRGRRPLREGRQPRGPDHAWPSRLGVGETSPARSLSPRSGAGAFGRGAGDVRSEGADTRRVWCGTRMTTITARATRLAKNSPTAPNGLNSRRLMKPHDRVWQACADVAGFAAKSRGEFFTMRTRYRIAAGRERKRRAASRSSGRS
jgi:hypothetical protein